MVVAAPVILLGVCAALSLSSFLWGLVLGSFFTYCAMRIYQAVVNFLYSTILGLEDGDSSSPLNCCFTSPEARCCSLHNSLLAHWRPPYGGPLVPLPRLRDLQAPPVPHLADEDVRSGPTSGPLGDSLGYKLDKANRPVYRAWMNEVGDTCCCCFVS